MKENAYQKSKNTHKKSVKMQMPHLEKRTTKTKSVVPLENEQKMQVLLLWKRNNKNQVSFLWKRNNKNASAIPLENEQQK